jgi:hypothetical protein
LDKIEVGDKGLISHGNFCWYRNPIPTHNVHAKGNMENISKNIPINVSKNLGVMESVLIRFDCFLEEFQIYNTVLREYHDICSWYHKEILGIDP